jgi:hypothetical protein
MKVYLAARYSRKNEIKEYSYDLMEIPDLKVTASWLDELHAPDSVMSDVSDDLLEHYADVDVHEVKNADVLVFFAEDPLVGTPRGGRHVEFGIALALGKIIFVVGPHENIFHYQPRVYHFDKWEQARRCLAA